ncbi:hypothetical protein StoSoilB5_07910 [Arthrobacter sp. StoSoilB5]|nr:hypothetical protein StoSoilB5_07910 [Arthrobacter sp. StoSoilB5]
MYMRIDAAGHHQLTLEVHHAPGFIGRAKSGGAQGHDLALGYSDVKAFGA